MDEHELIQEIEIDSNTNASHTLDGKPNVQKMLYDALYLVPIFIISVCLCTLHAYQVLQKIKRIDILMERRERIRIRNTNSIQMFGIPNVPGLNNGSEQFRSREEYIVKRLILGPTIFHAVALIFFFLIYFMWLISLMVSCTDYALDLGINNSKPSLCHTFMFSTSFFQNLLGGIGSGLLAIGMLWENRQQLRNYLFPPKKKAELDKEAITGDLTVSELRDDLNHLSIQMDRDEKGVVFRPMGLTPTSNISAIPMFRVRSHHPTSKKLRQINRMVETYRLTLQDRCYLVIWKYNIDAASCLPELIIQFGNERSNGTFWADRKYSKLCTKQLEDPSDVCEKASCIVFVAYRKYMARRFQMY